MSATDDKVLQLSDRLAELQYERTGLESTRTRDDAERAAKEYADAVRRTHADVGGFVLGGAILGDPLNSVLGAFIVSRPEFEAWLTEQAQAVGSELSDRQKKAQLSKLGAEIETVTTKLHEARKAAAMEQLEREFGGVAA